MKSEQFWMSPTQSGPKPSCSRCFGDNMSDDASKNKNSVQLKFSHTLFFVYMLFAII